MPDSFCAWMKIMPRINAISVTERSAPRRSLKYGDSYRISVHTLPESFLCQQAFTKAITIRLAQTQKETVLYLFSVLFLFFYQRAGIAQSIQLIDRLSVDWAMAYKNLNGGSQKWSYSLAVACLQIPPPLRKNRGGVFTQANLLEQSRTKAFHHRV